ncbi:hypothetical protein GGR22_002891 [Flavobacterium gossypii]|jgi:hypothetical protein|uniref:Lipoprotein n=1 Tax=Flavobacterium gossypii TaxID=1646119 RepID=A0ABR6DSP0_9FLAO|nr:hypothetical protein [Flavobacterium gossypii]MBA9074718.1 hypothetical protein [Flavobacterium gossypii]
MKKRLTAFFAILLIAITISCSSDDSNGNGGNPSPNKTAKFEITGNFTGHIFIVYNNNVTGNTTETITSLPWSKTINYQDNVTGIGISGNAVLQNPGVVGQNVSLKIYHNNSIVRQSNKIADSNGSFSFETLTFMFP